MVLHCLKLKTTTIRLYPKLNISQIDTRPALQLFTSTIVNKTFCMMTSSNENIFALLAICVGNSSVTGGFPSQRPITRSFDIFFDLRVNKPLSKWPKRRWFENLSSWLWRYCNVGICYTDVGLIVSRLVFRLSCTKYIEFSMLTVYHRLSQKTSFFTVTTVRHKRGVPTWIAKYGLVHRHLQKFYLTFWKMKGPVGWRWWWWRWLVVVGA